MAFLDVKVHQEQLKFDWDDINVGNKHLDHSQNFFSKKHYEHERLDEMDILQKKMIQTDINDSVENEKIVNVGESINCTSPDEERNENENIVKVKESINYTSPDEERNEIKISNSKVKECAASPGAVKDKVASNIACEWSTKKPLCSKVINSKGAVSKTMPPPPQAYLVKDIYQRNREEAERRRAEEERKLREFHSRPAPKFNHHHQMMQKRGPLHAVTVAITPQVLKKSREAEEKRRKRLEEWKQKNQPLKFESRPPTVLKEKPFVPEKKPFVVQQCPFKLQTEKRLQERKQYDEIKQKALEEKQKQVEIEQEERKRREKEHIRELRKATTFKARPNPFKN